MGDLLKYKEQRDAARKAGRKELIRVSESLGPYDDTKPLPLRSGDDEGQG